MKVSNREERSGGAGRTLHESLVLEEATEAQSARLGLHDLDGLECYPEGGEGHVDGD